VPTPSKEDCHFSGKRLPLAWQKKHCFPAKGRMFSGEYAVILLPMNAISAFLI
jgi:hypothetical protein